jgi:hypothetical protein
VVWIYLAQDRGPVACSLERGNESCVSLIDSDILDSLETSSSLRISVLHAVLLCFTTWPFPHIELSNL